MSEHLSSVIADYADEISALSAEVRALKHEREQQAKEIERLREALARLKDGETLVKLVALGEELCLVPREWIAHVDVHPSYAARWEAIQEVVRCAEAITLTSVDTENHQVSTTDCTHPVCRLQVALAKLRDTEKEDDDPNDGDDYADRAEWKARLK